MRAQQAPPTSAARPRTRARAATDRASRIGTHFQGAEGLQAPGAEKLRLVAGKVVPGTRYRIVRWVGEGGMGVVYEAEHVDIERRVALKILRFDLSQQPRMVQVFKDEARAAGKLGSPHVVEIYDFGELADGRLFFAMELLKGSDLVLDEGETLEPAKVIGILRQVCKGLLAAHRQDIVHRDVKPENIITTTGVDDRATVKVVDFGISAMLAAGPAQSSGGIAGTPHYMAPEQVLGGEFDARLDVYALGCTAYELLTGEPPFDADTVGELLQKHIDEAPVPPTRRRADLSIPPALEAVVMRCLAKQPDERFPDMAELEAALCEAQIQARLITAWDDLPLPDIPDIERRERIRQNRPTVEIDRPKRSMLWPIVAGAASLVAVGLAAMLALGGPTQEETDQVEMLVSEAKAAAAKSNWLYPSADDPDAKTALSALTELAALEGSAEDLAEERAEELSTEFAATLVRQGDFLWDHGAKDLAQASYMDALVFDDEQERAIERLEGVPPGLVASSSQRAHEGQLSDAETLLSLLAEAEATEDAKRKQALEEQAVALADATPLPAAAATRIDSVVSEDSLFARRARRRAAAEPEPEPELDTPEERPEIVEAEEAIEEADDAGKSPSVKRRRRQDPTALLGTAEADPQKAAELADQGQAALRAGRRSEAASLFNQAIAFDRRNGKALMGLSDVYFDTGQNQKAVIYAEKAVKASPGNESYRLKLGDAYYKVLRYKDALEQYEEAKRRGSTRADSRIDKVRGKLGG